MASVFLGALDRGRWVHAYVKRHNMLMDRMLGTVLIHIMLSVDVSDGLKPLGKRKIKTYIRKFPGCG